MLGTEYVVYYRVRGDELFVARVRHGARRPLKRARHGDLLVARLQSRRSPDAGWTPLRRGAGSRTRLEER